MTYDVGNPSQDLEQERKYGDIKTDNGITTLPLMIIVLHRAYHEIPTSMISNLVRTTSFWNNLHQVRSISKYWKSK